MADEPANLLDKLTPSEIALLLETQGTDAVHRNEGDPVLKRLLEAGLIDAMDENYQRPEGARYCTSSKRQAVARMLNNDGDISLSWSS